jgi:tRNA(adenine34) deaminase
MPNHQHFMGEALLEAEEALRHGEFPVGCVMVYEGRIVARGRRQQSGGETSRIVNELDHAEMVALRALLEMAPRVPPSQVTVYATLEPCLMCYAALLISGVRTIVYAYEDAMGGGTSLCLDRLTPLYQEMAVTILPHILRGRSLALFQQFFRESCNPYLGDTMLSAYTLAQP